MGFLDKLFPNPSDRATPILNTIPGTIKPYYEPYFNTGRNALDRVNTEYGNLLNDPNALIQRLGAGYKESPGYKWRLNQGENAITNAQAAGGMTGTGQHQQLAGELAENLANQDFNNFMQQILGLYGTGLQGEHELARMGQIAGSDLATSLGNILGSKAQMQYGGQANRNDLLSGILKSLVSFGSSSSKPFWMT